MPKKKKELNYLENLAKEFKQFNRARNWANVEQGEYQWRNWGKAVDSKTSARLKGDADRAHKQEKSALGQLAGAALQGRRYKGKKQIKKKK